MKNSQIEKWALQIVERVKANQPIEDSRVELKAKWPDDFARAARRIAGHANAARGENILWLIGVDESKGAVGTSHSEFSTWWAGVEKEFDELAPRCYDVNIPVSEITVVALVFETDRSPFVVKNPQYGKQKGDSVSLEVPWREGTRVRSAERADLLVILTPVRKQPTIEIIDARLNGGDCWSFELNIETYISCADDQSVIIPFHKCSVTFKKGDGEEVAVTPHISASSHSTSISTSSHDVNASKAGSITWRFLNISCQPQLNAGDIISFNFRLTTTPIGKTTLVTCDFKKKSSEYLPETQYELIKRSVG